jgi:UDP-glucose 4-epimerase
MSTLPCAFVTGATGVIGPSLVGVLASSGYRVRVLRRNPSAPSLLPAGVEIFGGDLSDADALETAIGPATVVFHLAAKLHVAHPTPGEMEEQRRTNVEGTRTLARVAARAGVRRLVYFSTINVYGATRPGSVCDEDSPGRPESVYAQTKLEAEEIVLSQAPSVVLRSAAVYGPRMQGNYVKLVALLRRAPFMIGDGSNRRTLIYVTDLCAAAKLAAESPTSLGRVFNVTDGVVHPFREIVRAISEAIGEDAPRVWIPERLARRAARAADLGLSLLGKGSSRAFKTIDKILEDVAVNGLRIQRELGFRPAVDLAQGWKLALREQTG